MSVDSLSSNVYKLQKNMNVGRDDDEVGFYAETETEVRYSETWDLPTRGGRNNNQIPDDIRTQKDFLNFDWLIFWFWPNY